MGGLIGKSILSLDSFVLDVHYWSGSVVSPLIHENFFLLSQKAIEQAVAAGTLSS
jgi:hypothetical protein